MISIDSKFKKDQHLFEVSELKLRLPKFVDLKKKRLSKVKPIFQDSKKVRPKTKNIKVNQLQKLLLSHYHLMYILGYNKKIMTLKYATLS